VVPLDGVVPPDGVVPVDGLAAPPPDGVVPVLPLVAVPPVVDDVELLVVLLVLELAVVAATAGGAEGIVN
jgi:hypothetical protein